MLQRVINILPIRIQQQLKLGNNKNILLNIAWLFGDKIFRLGGGLVIGVMVARYLGPKQFGIFNFAFSFVWLFMFIATLGLDEVVIREIITKPERKNEIIGTAFFLKLAGSFFAFLCIIAAFYLLPAQGRYSLSIILIMSISMLIRSVDVIRLWFESQIVSKYIVIAENAAFVVSSIFKIVLIYFKQPLVYFVWATFLEMSVAGLILVHFYLKKYNFSGWVFKKQQAVNLLNDSWPLIIAGLSIAIYVKSDQVLLGLLANENEAGIYSAAARVSEIWYFVPTAIVVSTFPSLIAARQTSTELYQKKTQQLFDLMTAISISIALPMTFLAGWVISLLFGDAYKSGGVVLSIHIWSGVFVFLGVASTKYFVAENLQKNQFYRTLIGAALNVILNIILIPIAGAVGSAIATVISYAASVFSAVLFRKTRNVSYMMLASFNIFRIYRQYRKL